MSRRNTFVALLALGLVGCVRPEEGASDCVLTNPSTRISLSGECCSPSRDGAPVTHNGVQLEGVCNATGLCQYGWEAGEQLPSYTCQNSGLPGGDDLRQGSDSGPRADVGSVPPDAHSGGHGGDGPPTGGQGGELTPAGGHNTDASGPAPDGSPADARMERLDLSLAEADQGRPDAAPPEPDLPRVPLGIPRGGDCEPADDQCDTGLVCVAFGEGGVCAGLCDTLVVDGACEADEICLAFEECGQFAARCEGFCLPSDDCDVADPSLACGGPASCYLLPPITLCDRIEGTALPGEPCGLTDPGATEHCAPGLACVRGLCEARCGVRDACGPGEVCVDYGPQVNGVGFKVCHRQCDVYRQRSCAVGEVCAPGAAALVGGRMLAIGYCAGDGQVQGLGVQNQVCQPSPDGSNYWGSCTAGHVCETLGLPIADVCMGFCTQGDDSLCTGTSACVTELLASEGLGLCLGDCDPFGPNDACGAGRVCTFLTTADGGQQLVGICMAGRGIGATGEACELTDPEFGVSDCQVGHLCTALEAGAIDTCVKLCDVAPQSPDVCPVGLMCRTNIFGLDGEGMGGNARFGLCVPEP